MSLSGIGVGDFKAHKVKRFRGKETIITKGERGVIDILANVPEGKTMSGSKFLDHLSQMPTEQILALEEKGLVEVHRNERTADLRYAEISLSDKGWRAAIRLGLAQKITI